MQDNGIHEPFGPLALHGLDVQPYRGGLGVSVVDGRQAVPDPDRHHRSVDPDGAGQPVRTRTHLPRTMGLIKTHRAGYLPPELNQVVAALTAGQRTPLFLMGTTWERHAWYLRLPSTPDVPGAPWAGVVRCEAATDLSGPS